jgi:hypothetical protein
VHHSSNFKSSKKHYFHRIIKKHNFAHTALFAYSVMLCNRYLAIQVCKKCAKMCRRAKQSPMDKSITGFMAGFRTSEQTPIDIEMRFTMNKLLSCSFNMDTDRVEARFEDGTTLAIDCIAVEDEYGNTPAQRAELDWLLYNKPLEYAQLVLGGGIEHYLSLGCDHGRLED